MKKLLRGIVDFRRNARQGYQETFARLALGQSPDALFIACSDSRVVPNVFASTEPGDLFVVRNPGNVIAPCGPDGRSIADESEAAAIEFAVDMLQVQDIVVCGHSECGAMRRLLEDHPVLPAPHLDAWLRHAEPCREALRRGDRLPGEWSPANQLSQLNVLRQVEHLRTYPSVAAATAVGRLRLHAWWFDIGGAEVLAWEADRGAFVVIDEEEAARIARRLGAGAPAPSSG